LGVLFLWILVAAGCGKANPRAAFDPQTGHADNWIAAHGSEFVAHPEDCAACHGADLAGGPSKVGCFSAGVSGTACHGAQAFHGAGWDDPGLHGPAAKGAPDADTGFSTCQTCHGDAFDGGIIKVSCASSICHPADGGTVVPHSPAPWFGAPRTHTTTDPDNASVCFICHGGQSPTPAPPGTAPGCFNNTLCHGAAHPQGWADPDAHGAAAKSAPGATAGFAACAVCHGPDFAGGSAGFSCAGCHGTAGDGTVIPHPSSWVGGGRTHIDADTDNASVCDVCHHLGDHSPLGPLPPSADPPGCFNSTLCHGALGHQLPFLDPALHGPQAKADLTVCQACHANPSGGGPGSNPRFNVPVGILANGCELCHQAFTAHPVPWLGPSATSHQGAGNMAEACALCHGASLDGGVGPACSTCHTAGSPVTVQNCASCHQAPPAGGAAPDRQGAHGVHDALPHVTADCGVCHDGAGSGTAEHFDGAVDVAFPATYDSKGGPASFGAGGSCLSVSCHGGQNTPAWLTGAIDVNADCALCHRARNASDQYNSYFSGRHTLHVVNEGFFCTECHDTGKLASVHFTDLNTPEMTEAALTLSDALNYNATARTCTLSCHGENHNQANW